MKPQQQESFKPTEILFLDIETISEFSDFEAMSGRKKGLFIKKFDYEIIAKIAEMGNYGVMTREEIYEAIAIDLYKKKAALFAEFGRVACVGIGFLTADGGGVHHLKTKCVINRLEEEVLKELAPILNKSKCILAHNGKEFDFRFLAHRYLINGMDVPHILNTMGKKPWEIPLLDTMELWKFGSLRHSASLDLLAEVFGLPSPKETMDGSQVVNYFYASKNGELPWESEEIRFKTVADYCVGDVVTLVNVYLRMLNLQPVIIDNITHK